MTLPRFFSRVDDSISPLLSDEADLRAHLSMQTICIEAPSDVEEHPVHVAGLHMATNLFARVYPSLRLVLPDRVASQCALLAKQINPACNVALGSGQSTAKLCWGRDTPEETAVTVNPSGWYVAIDPEDTRGLGHSNPLATLAAGAIGVSEVFRQVFAEFLTNPRQGKCPGGFNVLTLAGADDSLPNLPADIDVGSAFLIGAGAIGEAFAHAIAATGASGSLTVIDAERISLSNLQRYILANDDDVGKSKVEVVARALKGTKLDVVTKHAQWDMALAESVPLETMCVAVDSEALRIALQASLPKRAYNAWTQPADIGWSRHESFGVEPCLACLYWPTQPKRDYHELIANAIKEHPLRTLAYLVNNLPIDAVLTPPQLPVVQDLPAPPDSARWLSVPLLVDVASRFALEAAEVESWRGKKLSDLYHEGVCAGALLRHHAGEVTDEIAVPLAHQSALAGIMLAAQLLSGAAPALLPHRHRKPEGRLNLLARFPQLSARPRQSTPRCICEDQDFRKAYAAKWP